MNFMGQQRNRVEPLLLLLLGLICGSGLSKLLQLVRLQFYDNINAQTDISQLTYASSYSQHVTATDSGSSDKNTTQRILCIIMIDPMRTRQLHIERTWGRRCKMLLFLSGQPNKQSGVMGLAMRKGHNISWGRLRSSLQHVYKHYGTQHDWFLLVKDETYVIMENLQRFLFDHASETPIYFDSNSWKYTKKMHKSEMDSYIFSREALHRFMTLAHGNSSICSNRDYGMMHVEVARCFRNVGVASGNARDEHGLPLFAPKFSNVS
ncbi:GH25079 [Drosophila grimshawi]|uniref:N-acetylgalactosaminide beta-1,3-galactosyltransferase n=1 Tax=Drosophila grimshawi TaxID=7222 RepID=B4JZF0_DROGR|nr:GH25079 [Drosophila grimshawi]